MDFKAEISGNTLIAEIGGELDDHVAKSIKEKLDFALMKKEVSNAIFDLTGLSFMDSAGIGLLIGRYKQIHARKGKTIVVAGSAQVKRILKMSGVLNIFIEAETMADALEMVGLPSIA
ncbi:MAG: anti-sigma factor antagonist [Eubacteriaceae bacterium]|jgi:stage II sporulation protein AA (anti-sigma F factor antagonist)|nr:anti-sigma factor antagonist [Eubacteriaceae bacterium]